jgi:hypothetical protein
LRAALDALEAQDAARLEAVRAKLGRAIDDPRPSVSADEAFDRIEAALASRTRR